MNAPILTIQNVSKNFKGVTALQDLSFSIKKGEILGVIGPNGAGKTTLFQLISGFDHPDSGSITWQGKTLNHLKPYEICLLGIARTFQITKPMLGLSVLENVMIGTLVHTASITQAKEEASHILQHLSLIEKSHFMAEHLTLPERKCLEIARALSTKPQLILLDEVMAGLRPKESDFLVIKLQELQQKMNLTILIIEHAMRAIMALSHRILVLNQGKKIAEDIPSNIQLHPEVISSYLGQTTC